MDQQPNDRQPPKWRPLSAIERRIVGVLVEKAKTTPDAYPLSLNALTTGCNQKSNRFPHLYLEPDQVEQALERLRYDGAVGEVQGGGRVPRYRHYMKDWLGVNGMELAVMTELLLRGAQTVGQLRGRAARMAPIADVAALTPILGSLQERGLVISLTPPGRGQVVTHRLYQAEELARLNEQYGATAAEAHLPDRRAAAPPPASSPALSPGITSPAAAPPPSVPSPAAAPSADPQPIAAGASSSVPADEAPRAIAALREEVGRLREELEKLRRDVDDLWANLR